MSWFREKMTFLGIKTWDSVMYWMSKGEKKDCIIQCSQVSLDVEVMDWI